MTKKEHKQQINELEEKLEEAITARLNAVRAQQQDSDAIKAAIFFELIDEIKLIFKENSFIIQFTSSVVNTIKILKYKIYKNQVYFSMLL